MADQSYLSIYAKSFNWAGFFLPKQTYLKCSALYDFCRIADNIADGDDNIENKKEKFLNFQNNFNNQKFDDPIIKNMWRLIKEFNISKILSLTLKHGDLYPNTLSLIIVSRTSVDCLISSSVWS